MEGILGIDDRSCRPAIPRPEMFGDDAANSPNLSFRDACWSLHPFAPCCSPGTFFHQVDFVPGKAVRIDVFWMGQARTVRLAARSDVTLKLGHYSGVNQIPTVHQVARAEFLGEAVSSVRAVGYDTLR